MKTKKRNVVRGRCKGVEVGAEIYTFEQVASFIGTMGGVRFRKRSSRKVSFVSFDRLVSGQGVRRFVGPVEYVFELTAEGMSVSVAKRKGRSVVPWEALVNLSLKAPLLFSEMV